jgi:hypothetical protein
VPGGGGANVRKSPSSRVALRLEVPAAAARAAVRSWARWWTGSRSGMLVGVGLPAVRLLHKHKHCQKITGRRASREVAFEVRGHNEEYRVRFRA